MLTYAGIPDAIVTACQREGVVCSLQVCWRMLAYAMPYARGSGGRANGREARGFTSTKVVALLAVLVLKYLLS